MAKIVVTQELLKRCVIYFYIVCNVYAFYVSVFDGILIGDFHGMPAPEPMACFILFGLVVLYYWIFPGPIFNGLMRKSSKLQSKRWSGNIYSDLFIVALQLIHLWISLDLALGIAGVYSRPSSMLKYYVYFIPVEYIALLYVTVRANTAAALAVSSIYIVSGLLRGWSGVIIILGLVIAVRLCSSRVAINVWTVISVAVATFVLSPVVFTLRFLVRAKLGSFQDAIAYMIEISGSANVWQYAFAEVIARFQHLSALMVVFDYRDELRNLFSSGNVRLFLFDGNYGQAMLSVLGLYPNELGRVITEYILGFDPSIISYNVHTGLIAWFIIVPELSLLYIVYIAILCLANALLIRWAGFDQRIVLFSWIMWILLLINGWFGAFINYLVALFCFVVFRIFLATVRAAIGCQKSQGNPT